MAGNIKRAYIDSLVIDRQLITAPPLFFGSGQRPIIDKEKNLGWSGNLKIDPLAIYFEAAAQVRSHTRLFQRRSGRWTLTSSRKRWGFFSRPVNIYEVHADLGNGNPDGSPCSYGSA